MPNREIYTNNFYHVFNRGVDKRIIFKNPKQYSHFLTIIKHCLFYSTPLSVHLQMRKRIKNREKQLVFDNLEEYRITPSIEIISFCLMPNHYHLILKQKEDHGISNYMKRINTAYAKYFNLTEERTGTLFQGRFKHVLIETQEQLLHVSRYQHLNPINLVSSKDELLHYPWSSMPIYINATQKDFLKKEYILSQFRNTKKYQEFVLAQIDPNYQENFIHLYHDDDFGWSEKLKEDEKIRKTIRREKIIKTLS